ncbi:MAG: hypothetical protein QE269_03865 [Fimbriimonas sp.]|nr:hypothetical protein [Fimbriimonas sp.]
MHALRLRLLGGDVLTGPTSVEFPTRHHESLRLIKFVACQGREGVTSSRLIDALYAQTWDDPQNGLRTQLTRTNSRAAQIGIPKLLERVGEKVRFAPKSLTCDMWDLQDVCAQLSSRSSFEERELALEAFSAVVPERLAESLRAEPDALCASDIAESMLGCLEQLSLLPSVGSMRLRIVQVVSILRPFLPLSSLNVESLLKLYAATQCRQEVLQTYLDYETLLVDDLGERPATRIRVLCESLLRQLEQPPEDRRLIIPSKPEITFGREDLIELAAKLILRGGKLYVGGVAGVGKSHLLRCVVAERSLSLFRFCWINLPDESPDDLSQILPEAPADVIIVDGYSSRYSESLNYIERVCKCHSIVVVGKTSVGFSYAESLTVRPLDVGTPSRPGPATLLLESAISDPVTPAAREYSVSLAKSASGLPLSLKLVANLSKTVGIRAVAAQFESSPDSKLTAGQFLRAALAETLAQFEPQIRNGIIALAGIGERVPFSIAREMLNIDLWVLKALTDCGLVLVNRDQMELRASETVVEQIHSGGFEAELEHYLVEFLNAIVERCSQNGIVVPKEELLISHLRVLFKVASSLAARGEVCLALELLSSLRPHAAAFQDGSINPDLLEKSLWTMDLDPTIFIRYALALGTLYILRQDSEGLERFMTVLLQDGRLGQAPITHQIEIYSQMGLGLRLSEKLEESQRIFELALGMLDFNCPPLLELKLLHNMSITLSVSGKFIEALEVRRAAIRLAQFAPNDHYRVELLHMEALTMFEAGLPQSEVKSSFHVALGYARMYKLSQQEGWILQNAAKFLTNMFDPSESILLGAIGIGLQVADGLTAEVRRHVKGTCELIYEKLTALQLSSLALEARMLSERLTPVPLAPIELGVIGQQAGTTFSLPYSVSDSPVSFLELTNFVRSCVRIASSNSESYRLIDEWGLDVAKWLDLGSQQERIISNRSNRVAFGG